MKRALGLLALAVLVGAVAHGWYVHLHRTASPTTYQREISWLTSELTLSADQAEQIRQLHEKHCPPLDTLYAELQKEREIAPTAPTCEEMERRCVRSTERLIDEVTAVLSPDQRARYLELVKPCLRSDAAPAP